MNFNDLEDLENGLKRLREDLEGRESERECLKRISKVAKDVVNHWNEFGPECDFDCVMFRLEKALEKLKEYETKMVLDGFSRYGLSRKGEVVIC